MCAGSLPCGFSGITVRGGVDDRLMGLGDGS
jgi:hypothetical protein